jgi:hypothetical protein
MEVHQLLGTFSDFEKLSTPAFLGRSYSKEGTVPEKTWRVIEYAYPTPDRPLASDLSTYRIPDDIHPFK